MQVGKAVFLFLAITITTNGTAAGDVRCNLPVLANSNSYIGVGRAGAVSGSELQGIIFNSGASIAIITYNNAYPGSSGEVIYMNMTYEAL